jgi:hypothetical protein
LCDGVMIDAVRRVARAALVVREDRVGDDRASACAVALLDERLPTPLAANTSSAVRCAGVEGACVSLPT